MHLHWPFLVRFHQLFFRNQLFFLIILISYPLNVHTTMQDEKKGVLCSNQLIFFFLTHSSGFMVEAGFVSLDNKNRPMTGYAPPSSWRDQPSEWIFPYSRPGAVSRFALRCSLQGATGRLFIHASETGPDGLPRRENIQVLGIQLTNYTSGEKCSGSKTWEGVIQNERVLTEMFREFITVPLWESAEKEGGADDVEEDEDVEDEEEGEQQEEGKQGDVVVVENVVVISKRSLILGAALGVGVVTGVATFFVMRNHRRS